MKVHSNFLLKVLIFFKAQGSRLIGIYCYVTFASGNVWQMNISRDKKAAWPVANPVITCASASVAGLSSNFVADPFLYVKVIFNSLIFDWL